MQQYIKGVNDKQKGAHMCSLTCVSKQQPLYTRKITHWRH